MATPAFPDLTTGPGVSFGTEENDLFSGSGNNVLYMLGGDDGVRLGGGNDIVYVGDGSDVLYVEGGNDLVYGELGDDLIYAGRDNDVAEGGDGDDFLYGKVGDDILSGSDGLDTFVYTGADGIDVINVFNFEEDIILLTANINETGIASAADLAGRVLDDEAGAIVDLGADSYVQLSEVTQADVVGNLEGFFAVA